MIYLNKLLSSIQHKKKLIVSILILILIAIFIFLRQRQVANFGSAAKDPNACQIGGLMISLDRDIWNCDYFQVVRQAAPQGIFHSADSASVSLKYELQDRSILGNPCIQFEYYQFDDYTYKQYVDDMEEIIAEHDFESHTKSTAEYEGYEALVYKYSIKDGNLFYEVTIGKGTSLYGITYSSCESMYDEYLEAFEKALKSIHIKHF